VLGPLQFGGQQGDTDLALIETVATQRVGADVDRGPLGKGAGARQPDLLAAVAVEAEQRVGPAAEPTAEVAA
jgi:hypothetical protein